MCRKFVWACLLLCAATFATNALASDPSPNPWDPPRNFGSVRPPTPVAVLRVGNKSYTAPNYLVRPWYLTPYHNYAYYRPWYTYGHYGPTNYPYHYSPSWGYRPLPYYAPPYLSPGAYAPRENSALYHW